MMRFNTFKNIELKISNFSSQIVSFFLLIFISPIYLLICSLIYFIDGRPIFYNSMRVGYMGKIFKLYKFRTMSENNLEEKLRITKLGRFLRRSSLDELPQIFNIIKGDMVFVGPRPLPKDILYESKLRRFLKKRSSVKPGLTGLSQSLSKGLPRTFSEKLVYDFLYIKKKSILFDLIIILLTIKALKKRFVFNKSGTTL